MEQEIDIQEVLKGLRETIGNLAQENAVLRATIVSMKEENQTANS